jgi:hypothetical protein
MRETGDNAPMRRSPAALAACLLIAACGSAPNEDFSVSNAPRDAGGGGDDASEEAGPRDSGRDGLFVDDASDDGACVDGEACGDGGTCVSGVCCASGPVCNGACCAAGDVCSFGACATPGATCTDRSDCPASSYCDYALGSGPDGGAPDAGGGAPDAGGNDAGACVGGAAARTGRCLPSPPACAPDAGAADGGAITCLETCEVRPQVSDFTPVLKYAWGGQVTSPFASDVMMAPIVVELDDDDCDGKVTSKDVPEIVFVTFAADKGGYNGTGTLHAISIVGGQIVEKLSVPGLVRGASGAAAADLDGDGVPEIVVCSAKGPAAANTGVLAFHADGSVLWEQPDTTKVHCGNDAPAIGDVDGDGQPEVLVGLTLLDGKTGAVLRELDPGTGAGTRLTGLSDVDGDGQLDVVDGQRAYRADGSVIWDLRTGADAIPFGYHAVGDLDRDGSPEVVVISGSAPHQAFVVRHDASSASGAEVVRRGVDINNGISTAAFCNRSTEYGGGPPTIADFDGDGFADVGAAGAVGYVVLNGQKLMDPSVANASTLLWFRETHDCSSAVTGSSVFDFNGDGRAEVIYSDEYHLWMYDGPTGTDLIPSTCNTTGTLWEYPLVADVDADGQADIVVASNAYALTCPDPGPNDAPKQSGIRVFGSATQSWVRTRRVWNEHAYHVTNVDEDGRVPAHELPNWKQAGLNDYRQNKQPGAEFAAPNAIVSVAPRCAGEYGIVATVRNVGQASLPAGVTVGFYAGTPPGGTSLGQGLTTLTLYPAESEDVFLPLPSAPPGVAAGTTPVYAVVDDGMPAHPAWTECRTDDDVSAPVKAKCGGVH